MAPTSLRKTFLDCKMAKYFKKKERFTYVSKGQRKFIITGPIKKKTTKLIEKKGGLLFPYF